MVRPEFENEEAADGVEALKDADLAPPCNHAEVNVAPSKPITILIKTSDSKLDAFFNDNVNHIKRFTTQHLEIGGRCRRTTWLCQASQVQKSTCCYLLTFYVEEELACLKKLLNVMAKRTGYGL